MSSAVDDIEMRLIASGYVVGEWTATEIAQVIAPEVEALRAQVEALRNSLGHCAAENATLRENDVLWRSRMKTAEAQVQRVRDMCDGIEPDHSVFVGDVLDALNGGRR